MDNEKSNYAVWHRLVDISAISLFFAGILFLLWDMPGAPQRLPVWGMLTLLLSAYLAADFVSGLVHFLADSFGRVETPIFGRLFIYPFREHHADPLAITRHSFLETNGANSLISLPVLGAVLALTDAQADLFFRLWVCFFLLAIFLTNQIHQWSHQAHPVAPIRLLQRCGLILTPKGHAIHHTAPHDTYFCITSGWLNPVLTSLRFFPALKATIVFSCGICAKISGKAGRDSQTPSNTMLP